MTATLILSFALAAASASATLLVPRAAPWPVPTPQQIAYGGSMSALIRKWRDVLACAHSSCT